MKKMLSAVLTLCLIVALLPGIAVSARAATSNPEKSLQYVFYYDSVNKKLLEDNASFGILVKSGANNLIITNLPSRESEKIYIAFSTENGGSSLGFYGDSLTQDLHLYVADSKFGEAEGFTALGAVTEGETVHFVAFDKDGNKISAPTTAIGFQNGKVLLNETVGKMSVPLPVLNSKYEVCAVYYGEDCFALATDENTFYSNSKPAETESPATEPPATEPPTTEAPATEPSPTESPATVPPATEDTLNVDIQDIELPVDLPDLTKLKEEAVIQQKSSQSGTIAIVGIGVLAVILLVAVIIVRRKNQMKVNEELDEAEEGTQLVDESTDTGLRLQFRNGKRIAVRRSFTIGRAPDNDILIPRNVTSVSGRHCEIVVQNGVAYLRDMGSTNGTFINGRRVPSGQLVQLQPGMTVSLGSVNSAEMFHVTVSSRQM